LDATPAYYSQAYAWRDDDEDGTSKAHYAFIHHEVAADGTIGPANITACQLGIATLNGGRLRPGTRPRWAGDRQGIWRHLSRHLEDADVEPAPLRERSIVTGVDALDPASWMIERRVAALDAEVRAAEGAATKLAGYAAVFGELSLPLGFSGQRTYEPYSTITPTMC